jgi:hypothetical protein
MFATKGYESKGLIDFVSYYATKVSYSMASHLTEERCGGVSMSDQHIQSVVLQKAEKIGKSQQKVIEDNALSLPVILENCNIYDSNNEEVLWLEDGVCVSKQKENRDKISKESKQRTTTDSIIFQCPNGSFETIVAADGVDLTAFAEASLKVHYTNKPISIVVISDGSRTIKNRCISLFGTHYSHILDWYHLQKKVRELMTMVAPNKELKIKYIQELLGLLWQGKTVETLIKLNAYTYRNQVKWEELIGYLTKNENHIIDYEKRKSCGKIIGSGRMEKTVDCLVARRQKEKSMSWSQKGSNALAVLSAQYLNIATDYLQ